MGKKSRTASAKGGQAANGSAAAASEAVLEAPDMQVRAHLGSKCHHGGALPCGGLRLHVAAVASNSWVPCSGNPGV